MPRKPAAPAPFAEPDPASARKAFNTFLPRLQALPSDAVASVNADLQDAAITALSVARFLATSEARSRFGHLSPRLFDPAHLADLEPLALTVQHIDVELRSVRATATEAKLPVALVDEAIGVKERMIELAAYVFKRDLKLSREVADIRTGTGYKDLASDLARLARIYVDHKNTVERDTVNYRAGDDKLARSLAQKILTELGEAQSKEEKKWVDLAARAFTLLRDEYDEVQAAGQFLYRHEEPEQKFPSLYTGNRSRHRRTAAAVKESSGASPAPGGKG
jgi:hypothetical protein